MHDDISCPADARVALQVAASDVEHLRFMLGEQITGDAELLREIEAGRAPSHEEGQVLSRLRLCWALVDQVGGLFGDTLPVAA